MIPNSWWLSGLAGLVVVTALPFAGHLIRGDREDRCAWDGLELEPVYQVRIVEGLDVSHRFCCLRCAELWLERRGDEPIGIYVTDEAGGAELEASAAFYVRSTVATNAVTGERRHAFRTEEDAQKHATAARGRLLQETEKPFAGLKLIETGTSSHDQ